MYGFLWFFQTQGNVEYVNVLMMCFAQIKTMFKRLMLSKGDDVVLKCLGKTLWIFNLLIIKIG